MTLRVAHVLNMPGHGGVPRVVAALVRHADRARLEPAVFHLKNGAGPDLLAGSGIETAAAPEGGGKLGAITALQDWLEDRRIDILHCHSFRPNLLARLAGAPLRAHGLRIVAHYHNDYSDKWADPGVLRLERRLAGGVTDAAVAVSHAVARHVAERVGAGPAPEVIGNGIDRPDLPGRATARAALGLPADAAVVGLVGRLCRQKGVDLFVEAAVALAPRLPRSHFLVVGEIEDPGLARALTARVDGSGLGPRIRFAGFRDDIATVYAALDILAAPSRWEGFGLALAEAMAAGVPVVASDVGGIPEVTGGAACLVPPGNATALAAVLQRLIADPSARRAMATAGRRAALRFDWAHAAARIDALYHRLAAGG